MLVLSFHVSSLFSGVVVVSPCLRGEQAKLLHLKVEEKVPVSSWVASLALSDILTYLIKRPIVLRDSRNTFAYLCEVVR